MILKERPVPIQILQREALLRRLDKSFYRYKEIEKDLIHWKAGYAGEKNTDYYLSYLPEEQFGIINDLRLKNQNTFQMDTVLFSLMFGLILEIKNIAGTLFFDQHTNSVTRIYKDIEEGIANPLIQARRHRIQLLQWMIKHKLPPIPLEYLVVISRNSTILKTNPGNEHIFNNIIYAECLEEKINQLAARYQTAVLKNKSYNKLTQLLLTEHIPFYPEILKMYGIGPTEIVPGVQCPTCKRIPILRVSAAWYCPSCETYSKDAHFPAVRDYFLLQNEKMTIKQFQEFLLIDKRGAAKALLHSLQLQVTGSGRTTQYYLPPDCILSPLNENDRKKGDFY
ncbi:MAG: nuclease-related domain-containing protein [Bacillus sp. (in: firmicutes)]